MNGKELVIFDVDKTLIDDQSQRLLLKYAFKKKLIKPLPYAIVLIWFVAYKLHIAKDPKKPMEYAYAFLKGKNTGYFEEVMNDFFNSSLKYHIYTDGVELIQKHKEKGRVIILLSNAIEPILKVLANFLSADSYIGTKLEVENGKFTGKIEGDIMYGDRKVLAIREFVKRNNASMDNSRAYGDHVTDLAILNAVKIPCAVNPSKKLLKQIKNNDWPVLFFKETIK